jgi:hypothetical protein
MKKFTRVLVSILLKLSLFSLAFAIAFVAVFGSPDFLKKTLADSKLYETVVDNVIESSQGASQEEGFPINQPEVQEAIKKAFPPNAIQGYSEQFIDASHRWLSGEVERPDFRIDLTAAKQQLADGVAAYAEKRYAGLPVCSLAQARQLSTTDIDPFNVPCQIPGFNPAAARQNVIDQVASSNEFLSNPVLTAEHLPKDQSGKTAFDNMEPLRGGYKLVLLLPWLLGGLSLLLGLALLYLHDTKRGGFRSIGGSLAGNGLFLLISTLVILYVFNQVNKPGGVLNRSLEGSFQDSILHISRSINSAFNRYVIIISIVYIVAGGAILLYLRLTDKKLTDEEQQALLDSMAKDKKPATPPTDTPPENKKEA